MLLAGLVATYKKANLMLYTFSAADPVVKSRLLQSYCLSLYGCSLWDLSCASIHTAKMPVPKQHADKPSMRVVHQISC